jgi:hypothetical protein
MEDTPEYLFSNLCSVHFSFTLTFSLSCGNSANTAALLCECAAESSLSFLLKKGKKLTKFQVLTEANTKITDFFIAPMEAEHTSETSV